MSSKIAVRNMKVYVYGDEVKVKNLGRKNKTFRFVFFCVYFKSLLTESSELTLPQYSLLFLLKKEALEVVLIFIVFLEGIFYLSFCLFVLFFSPKDFFKDYGHAIFN